MKMTNHHELRRDVSIDCSEPKITDQSFKNMCDINIIMANYAKTGLFGHLNNNEPRYVDNSTIPNLEEAFDIVNRAEMLFYELPADIRKLMDNDPSQLEGFIQNPENAEILLKNGVIVKREEPKKPFIQELTELLKSQHTKTDKTAQEVKYGKDS
jgi:phage internal scaffolding protein